MILSRSYSSRVEILVCQSVQLIFLQTSNLAKWGRLPSAYREKVEDLLPTFWRRRIVLARTCIAITKKWRRNKRTTRRYVILRPAFVFFIARSLVFISPPSNKFGNKLREHSLASEGLPMSVGWGGGGGEREEDLGGWSARHCRRFNWLVTRTSASPRLMAESAQVTALIAVNVPKLLDFCN